MDIENKTEILFILPNTIGHRINLDLDIDYTIDLNFNHEYRPYQNLLKNYSFEYDYISIGDTNYLENFTDYIKGFKNNYPNISHVLYMDPANFDSEYFYKCSANTITYLMGLIADIGIPVFPINIFVEEDPFFELSLRGHYVETLEIITSLPKVLYSSGKLLFPKNDLWLIESEKELFKYLQKSPKKIFDMNGYQFESFIASIFKANGADVSLTPRARDGGYDIMVIIKDNEATLIECKRYKPTKKIGIGVVQRLIGATHQYRATKGMVVTTSSFSKDAIKSYEATKEYIDIKDFNDIILWLKELNLQYLI